ncbi:hypothetical protein LXL04_000637 [Taraxacum kok-saghyz]
MVLRFAPWISSRTLKRVDFTAGTQLDRRKGVVFVMDISKIHAQCAIIMFNLVGTRVLDFDDLSAIVSAASFNYEVACLFDRSLFVPHVGQWTEIILGKGHVNVADWWNTYGPFGHEGYGGNGLIWADYRPYYDISLELIILVKDKGHIIHYMNFVQELHLFSFRFEQVINQSDNPLIKIPAIRTIGQLSRTFPARQTHIIGPLIKQLGHRNLYIRMESVIALGKFTSPENFLSAEHSKTVFEFEGIQPLLRLLRGNERT